MSNPKDPNIANRESWLKVCVIGGFSALIAWKVLSAPIIFNLSDFRFTDLLNLLLAFFAIALSVAFYFKATDKRRFDAIKDELSPNIIGNLKEFKMLDESGALNDRGITILRRAAIREN